MLGRILIAGMASLFICIFLGPKFIEFLRAREFGQHIREEGPAGHAVKAGTPTMGGLVLFLAVSVPFLILSKHDRASMAVFGTAVACAVLGFLDDWTKVSKKRSPSAPSSAMVPSTAIRRSAGLRARWSRAAFIDIGLAL